MSESERSDLAKVTCSVMGESRNMDSAFRVKEMNAAREKLGGEVYLKGDGVIKGSLECGLCEELVLDDARYPQLVAQEIITAAADRMMAAADERRLKKEKAEKARETELREKRLDPNYTAGVAFLAKNANKKGVEVTASGLQIEQMIEGSQKPTLTDTVSVHYEGKLVDGTIFDSSILRGEPVEIRLNQVIQGWAEGLQLIGVGGKARLTIPENLAYGSGGIGSIPPYSVLLFEVQLIEIK